MRIGVPKEIKTLEYRVGLTPESVGELTRAGHQVVVETGAGAGSGFSDEEYTRIGATIAPDADAASDYGNTTLYTGRTLDVASGLMYYRARYYHPQLGRFVGRDPIEYQDAMSLYSYTKANPATHTDFSGTQSQRSSVLPKIVNRIWTLQNIGACYVGCDHHTHGTFSCFQCQDWCYLKHKKLCKQDPKCLGAAHTVWTGSYEACSRKPPSAHVAPSFSGCNSRPVCCYFGKGSYSEGDTVYCDNSTTAYKCCHDEADRLLWDWQVIFVKDNTRCY